MLELVSWEQLWGYLTFSVVVGVGLGVGIARLLRRVCRE